MAESTNAASTSPELRPNKAELIRRAIEDLGTDTTNKAIMDWVNEKFGVKVRRSDVSQQRSRTERKVGGTKRGRPRIARNGRAARTAEKNGPLATATAKPGSTARIDQADLDEALHFVQRIGGLQRARDAIALLESLTTS